MQRNGLNCLGLHRRQTRRHTQTRADRLQPNRPIIRLRRPIGNRRKLAGLYAQSALAHRVHQNHMKKIAAFDFGFAKEKRIQGHHTIAVLHKLCDFRGLFCPSFIGDQQRGRLYLRRRKHRPRHRPVTPQGKLEMRHPPFSADLLSGRSVFLRVDDLQQAFTLFGRTT